MTSGLAILYFSSAIFSDTMDTDIANKIIFVNDNRGFISKNPKVPVVSCKFKVTNLQDFRIYPKGEFIRIDKFKRFKSKHKYYYGRSEENDNACLSDIINGNITPDYIQPPPKFDNPEMIASASLRKLQYNLRFANKETLEFDIKDVLINYYDEYTEFKPNGIVFHTTMRRL